MLNISEERNINFEKFLHYAQNIGIYVNKHLCIKEVSKGNNGIFSNNDIHKNELLIKLPKSFLIPKSIFTNYIIEQEIEYPDMKFLDNYFSSIPSYEYFKKNSIYLLDQEKKNKILNFFVELSPSRRKIDKLFSSFDKLNDLEKYISLIFKTRAFNFENNQYLCPIIDLVNYKYQTPKVLYNKEGMHFKNNTTLTKYEQFYHGYENQSNIIFFFLNYNFLPNNFNRVSIPSNFFSLNIPQNKKDLVDEHYWIISNGKLSNKKRIVFDNLTIPVDFKLEINKLIPNSSIVNKILISILEMLKNEIKYQDVIKFLNKDSDQNHIHNFVKSLEINYLNIQALIDNLSKS